jgi:hypothetical protein
VGVDVLPSSSPPFFEQERSSFMLSIFIFSVNLHHFLLFLLFTPPHKFTIRIIINHHSSIPSSHFITMTVKLSDKSNFMNKGAHGNPGKKRYGKHHAVVTAAAGTANQKSANAAATSNNSIPPKAKETTKAEHRDSSPDYRHNNTDKISSSKDVNVPEKHSRAGGAASPPAAPSKNKSEEANVSKIKYLAGKSNQKSRDEAQTQINPSNKIHRGGSHNGKGSLRRNVSHGKRRVKKEHDTASTISTHITPIATDTDTDVDAPIASVTGINVDNINSSHPVPLIAQSQAPLENDTIEIDTNAKGKEQSKSNKGCVTKRNSYRGKQKVRPGKSAQEVQDKNDYVHHTAAISSDDPNMEHSLKQADANHAEVEESIHHVKTNAMGLTILHRLSGGTLGMSKDEEEGSASAPHTTVEDYFDSMEVNRSSTGISDSLLTEEMSRIDLCMEKDEGHYDDSNMIAMDEGNGMNGNDNVNQNGNMNTVNGYYPPQPMQQHQQHQAMMMMMPPGAEYYPMVQDPAFAYGIPYDQYMTPHPYEYAMPFDGYQNEQSGLNQGNFPSGGPMIHVPQMPLRYDQVTMGGTVFFNPVYTEDEVEEDKMQGQGSNGEAAEARTKTQKKKRNTSRKKKKNRGSKAPAVKREK